MGGVIFSIEAGSQLQIALQVGVSSSRVHGAVAFFVCSHVWVGCEVSIAVGCEVSIAVVAVVLTWREVSVVVVVGVVAVKSLWPVLAASGSVVISIALTVHRFGFSAVGGNVSSDATVVTCAGLLGLGAVGREVVLFSAFVAAIQFGLDVVDRVDHSI